MNEELNSIVNLAKKATVLLAISFVFEILIKFEHRYFHKLDTIYTLIFIRLIAFIMYAVCVYKLLVYKNIIK